MKFINLITLIIIVAFTSCAQHPETPEAWLKQNTVELEPEGNYDFAAIGKVIGDKRIIALGESSHGLGKFYEMKSALVKYLYEEKGFEVIAMEGGLGDINIAYSNIDTLSSEQLRDNTVFGNFRASEVTPMFELIKTSSTAKSPLIYTGYDSQSSSTYVNELLKKIVLPYNKTLSDSLQQRFYAYYYSTQAQDSTEYYLHINRFMNTSEEVKDILTKNVSEIKESFNLSDFQMEVIKKTLDNYRMSVDLPYNKRYEGNALRDKLMYENLKWLMTELYPNKKIIIWAHNAHIENKSLEGGNIKWMGHYLKEEYKDDYYALGLFAYKGNTYQHWTRETVSFENSDSTYLEKKMVDTGKKAAFLNLDVVKQSKNTQWLFESIHAYEVENMGEVSFVAKKRFDGIITIYESMAPTYAK